MSSDGDAVIAAGLVAVAGVGGIVVVGVGPTTHSHYLKLQMHYWQGLVVIVVTATTTTTTQSASKSTTTDVSI